MRLKPLVIAIRQGIAMMLWEEARKRRAAHG